MNNYNTNTTSASKTASTTNTLYNSKRNTNMHSTINQKYSSNGNKAITEKNVNNLYTNKNDQPQQKSMLIAYLLWLFLFGVGAHRFYTKNTTSAFVILALTIAGFIIFFYYPRLSSIIFLILTVWVIIDAFLTYKNVKNYNENIEDRI